MIFNYSFSPITDFIKSIGVIDIEDADIEQLRQHLEFEYTPTMQDIRMRCSLIADYANANNHFKIYIKSYSTFQSYLIQEFQSRGIRVFVPNYKKMDQDESLVSYNGFNKVSYLIEVGIYEVNFRSINSVEYIGHFDDVFSFKSTRASIAITYDNSFIEEVRTNNIHHLMTSKYNILISNMSDFLLDVRNYFNSELFNTCTDMDSQDVSNFLNYCNYLQTNFRTNDPQTADDFESTLISYEMLPEYLKSIVNLFLTSKFIKLNTYRNFNLYFNLAALLRALGFYYLIASELQKSNKYLKKYLNMIDTSLYDTDVIFHPKRNLILNLIKSNQFKKAEVLVLEMLENCDEIQYQFIYQDLANIYRQTGRMDQAIKVYNKLIEIDTLEMSNGYSTYLAIIYYKMGEIEQALELIVNSIQPKSVKDSLVASRCAIIYFDHHMKLPSLETLRYTKLTDPQIGQQLKFFEILDKFISDNDQYVNEFSEFLDMLSSYIPYNYICFIILFKYYIKNQNYDRIIELMDRIEGQFLRDDLRDNINLARIYIKNKNFGELNKLFDVSLVNFLF